MCSPFLNATLPPITVARMPFDFCFKRHAPVGRSCSIVPHLQRDRRVVEDVEIRDAALKDEATIDEAPVERGRERDHLDGFLQRECAVLAH